MNSHSRFLVLLCITFLIIACLIVRETNGDRDLPYFIQTVVGNGDSQNLNVDVPGLSTSIGSPVGVTRSKNGDLYFTSPNTHVVLKAQFNPTNGSFDNVVIVAGTGTNDFGSDNVSALTSALSFPQGVTLIEDSNGDSIALLFADNSNHRIRKLDMTSTPMIVTTIVGTGQQGFGGDGSSATNAKLDGLVGVYYDKVTGDIYVVDSYNHRIRRVSGGAINTVVGKQCAFSEGLGDGGPALQACLKNPSHFTMNDAGEWFIADSGNGRIRKVDSNGDIHTVVGGGNDQIGDAPALDVKLTYPIYTGFTQSGEMLVADYQSKLRLMDKNGFMKVIVGDGAVSPSNPILAKKAIAKPTGLIYVRDGSETIFMTDLAGYIHKVFMFECFGMKGTKACSAHGMCVQTNQCQCDVGWMGMDCSITHCFGVSSNQPDRVCSGRGSCVKPNKCHCEDGYRGHKCHRPLV